MQLVRRGSAPAFELIYERHARRRSRSPTGWSARAAWPRTSSRRRSSASGARARATTARAARSARGCSASSTTARSTRCAARSCTSAGARATRGSRSGSRRGERTDVEVARREEARDRPRARWSTCPPSRARSSSSPTSAASPTPRSPTMLETPVGTVKGRMRLGLEKMRNALGGRAGEPGMSEHDALARRRRRLRARRAAARRARGLRGAPARAARSAARDVEELRVAADALPVSVAAGRAAARRSRGGSWPSSSPRRSCSPPRAGRADAPRPRPARRGARGAGRGWPLGPASRSPGAAVLLVLGGVGGALLARRRRRTRDRRGADRAGAAPTCELEVGDDGATLVARDMPAPPAGPHLPGVAQAARAAIREPTLGPVVRARDGSADGRGAGLARRGRGGARHRRAARAAPTRRRSAPVISAPLA